jgi:hypothetical protein
MISYRANLFESLNKQIPKVIFGQTWIKIINPELFNKYSNALSSLQTYKAGEVYLISSTARLKKSGKIILMGIVSTMWASHILKEEDFNKIPKQDYLIVPSPLDYKYKIGQKVRFGAVRIEYKIIYFATGNKRPGSKDYAIQSAEEERNNDFSITSEETLTPWEESAQ